MDEINAGRIVTDRNNIHYTLSAQLGQGGQGEVWSCKEDKKIAIKINNDANISERSIARVRRLPLNSLEFAFPRIALKEPDSGYIMELVDENMISIRNAFKDSQADTEKMRIWYAENGSLRRRLNILRKVAWQLYNLHSRGMIYGDISLNNILVSRDVNFSEICFIDCDNITYESILSSAICTKFFGAPELHRKISGNTSLSEVFAFAVLAFYLLRGQYPFQGDLVMNSTPEEIMPKVNAGEIPYIDAPGGANGTSLVVPHEYVFTTKLNVLFKRTFMDGLNEPVLRPRMREWLSVLEQLSLVIIRCPSCSNFYYKSSKQCPWCKTAYPKFLNVLLALKAPYKKCKEEINKEYDLDLQPSDKVPSTLCQMLLAEGERKVFSEYVITGGNPEKKMIEITLTGSTVTVVNSGFESIIGKTNRIPMGGKASFSIADKGFMLEIVTKFDCKLIIEFRPDGLR